MVSYIVSRIMVVGLGTLYPAYRSYKAIKSKDTKEYVKWMMYWIVFAIFITAEIFVDTLVGFWMPFYYEIKILFLFWLLSPTTRGSSILYKKFVHPFFTEHEKDIDAYIGKAKEHGYGTLVQYGKKGLDLAADTMMKTAISGQDVLVQQLRRYKSESAINELVQSSADGGAPPDSDNSETTTDGGNPEQRQTTDAQAPTEPTRESSNFAPMSRDQAMSMDNLHLRSTMTSSNSLMYDSNTLPGRYYDGTDETLRSRPSSSYYEYCNLTRSTNDSAVHLCCPVAAESSSTLPRYRHTHTTYDYSSRPYESTSNLPTTSDMASSYTRYSESSTLPRSRDSSHRYNTRNSRTGRY